MLDQYLPPLRFPTSAMSGLVDRPVRYDLAESTCPPLRLGELGDLTELAGLPLGYGTSRGDSELRELIAAEAGADPGQVLVTVGAIEAMFLLAQDRRHGRMLVVGPSFPPAREVPEGLGARVDTVPLRFDDGYRLPLDAIEAALGPDVTLVSCASPQNPSGVRFTDDELRSLLARVERRAPEAVVLVDETYRASTYGSAPVPGSAIGLSPRVVTCSSLSKAHGAPGLRIGWLVTADAALYERLRNAKFLSTVTCSVVDELLGTRVLRSRRPILAARAERLARALDELVAWCSGRPVDLVRPDGGALCCLRLRADRFPDDAVPAFYARLAELDTRVAPGHWFGEPDRVFRLGFGHLEEADFTEALSRLAEALTRSSG
ncbi:pyridoxal phosphate-dependent aminotransferase [Pseudonocardia eucalypti]|uniref:Aminotransferase n=1 Tax=Pseudonocardia eucalypti TaxID=648755 RepID=A0ABP9Q195_9PSEU|nr:aspartate/methionine/tyrosine aminotransferase [Pseudonocardia eucalypti]